ncbi:phage integrase [Massilia varians]|uniref:Phage integrase n=1 Tax=Massilia varians TaxID=457921 RepID=A0ABM8C5B0_9BURK|nr:site-specific integrase [Massilia varians]BDT58382.1 phage integrase [Massilia varians]
MARLIEKLSPLEVSKKTKPGYYADGAGLWLQVSPTGSKSWIFRYTIAGKQREMGLGPFHTVSLAEARTKAKECRLALHEGKDPLELKRSAKLAAALDRARLMTFDQCAAAYIAAHRASWSNPKHVSQWENTLATYASPIIGALPVAEVDTPLVVKVLSPIWQTKTETATRLRGRIENILDWATVSKYRTGENPARWRGHLENVLANPNKIAPVVHHPALPWQEIGAFMAELRTRPGRAACALEFLILTGVRSGSVRGTRWDEIDFDRRVWTVPASRMKSKQEFRVPLSSAALALLGSMPRTGELVFPGRKADSPQSDMTLTAVLRRMGREDISVHGFRSTFRDWCSESLTNSFPHEVIEQSLAHTLPNKVEAVHTLRSYTIAKQAALLKAASE